MASSPPSNLDHEGAKTVGQKVKKLKDQLFNWYKTERPGIWVLPLLALLVVGVVFCVVGPVYHIFADSASAESGSRSRAIFLSEKGTITGCPAGEVDDKTFVLINLSVTQLTAAQASMRIVADFNAYGNLTSNSEVGLLDLEDNQKLFIWLGKNKQSYGYGDVLGKLETTELLDYSTPYSSYTFYPLDRYLAYPSVSVYLETTSEAGATVATPVPICLVYMNHLPTFDSVTVSHYADYLQAGASPAEGKFSFIWAQIKFSRTTANRFFSIFIVLLMWALSAFQMVLAIDHLFLRPREPLPPTLGFSIALLFALPAVRNTQPEVPPIGVVVDMLGFFWNMSIASVAAMMFMAAFVGYHKHAAMKW